jgi:hypothetical protein
MSAAVRLSALVVVLLLAACVTPRPVTAPPIAGTERTPLQLLAAVQSDADGIEQAKDPAQHAQLLAEATLSAQQCLAQSAASAICRYTHAQVLGLTAREHPVQAVALLKQMLAELMKAEGLDPALDHAGPARLTAVVLLRAPPWPLGPGDVDGALVAAQRAVQRDSTYPPNLITLAQVEAKSENPGQARATYAKAQSAVQAWTASADRAQWQRSIEQGLRELQ